MERNSVGLMAGVVIAIVVCVAAIVACAVVICTPSEYTISYELDGGTNDMDNPSMYKYGEGTQLNAAYKEGYVFIGWYSDSAMTNKVEKITTSDIGDKTLYAKWRISNIGEEWTYTVSGDITNTPKIGFKTHESVSGSYSVTQLMYAYECGFYTYYDYSIKTGLTTDAKNGYYYTMNDTSECTDTGETEVLTTIDGQKVCKVMEIKVNSETTYTGYVGSDNGRLYKVREYTVENYVWGTTVTDKIYTLSEAKKSDGTATYSADVYCDHGVSVTGYGDHKASDNLTFSYMIDDGMKFSGWYSSDNILLSRSQYFVMGPIYTDYTIYAMNDKEPDVVYDSKTVSYTSQKELSNVTWTFTENGEEKSVTSSSGTFEYTFSDADLYKVNYTGTDNNGKRYCGTVSMIVGGMIKQTYEWTYGNGKYTETLYIKYDDYLSYCNLNPNNRTNGSDDHNRQFVTSDDQYVKKLAQDLRDMQPTLSDADFAQFVLNFVQNIEYVSDTESKGATEYWKYPLETLYEHCGDCEDTAILYCALMDSRGFDTALLLFTGAQYQDNAHCASGIAVDASGKYYEVNGIKYYYCETTGTGWYVGVMPDGYGNARVVTI